MKIKFIPLLVFAALASVASAKAELFGIPEIPVPTLPDVAFASFTATGQPVIYYNPTIKASLGNQVFSFIRAHEYAHHKLGHTRRQMYATSLYQRVQFDRAGEIEADQFATEYWMQHDPTVVRAFVDVMRDPATANWGDLTHLPSFERANLIEIASKKRHPKSDDEAEGGADISGTWEGTPRGLGMPLVFEIDEGGEATGSSPAQGGTAPATVKMKGHKVTLTIGSWGVVVTGTLDGDTITGTFKQHGMNLPVTLERQ